MLFSFDVAEKPENNNMISVLIIITSVLCVLKGVARATDGLTFCWNKATIWELSFGDYRLFYESTDKQNGPGRTVSRYTFILSIL